jgi:predicted transcriptional regulator
MSTRVVTAHISKDLAKRLDGAADRLDRPKGWVVKEALTAYLDLEEERHRLTLEALAEVDSGQTVSHEEIEAWAKGLGKSRSRRR